MTTDSNPTDTITVARCIHCDNRITHGGTSALENTDLWFSANDDFTCPDGENFHEPWTAFTSTATDPNACTPGQKCQDINRLCTRHSAQYQAHHGRASNE